MYIPVTFNKFFSVDETISRDLLSGYLPEGTLYDLKNCVLDNPKGKIRCRGGFLVLNSNVTTSDIIKLIDTKDSSGNSYFIAGMNTKLQKSSGGAWSDVLTGLGTTGWFTNSSYRDGLIIASDNDPPYWLSGAGWSINTGLQLAKPVSDFIKIQRAKTAYGNLTENAGYAYCLVYRSEFGDASPPSHVIYMGKNGGSGSNNFLTTTTTLKAFYLQDIPVPTDTRITVKTLYRTEGNGKILYKLADLGVDVTEYEDIASDADLDFSDTPSFVRVVSNARTSAIHQDRVWFGNIGLIEKFFYFTKIPSKTVGSDSTAPSGTVYEDVLSTFPSSPNALYYFRINFTSISTSNGHAIGLTPLYYYQWMVVWVDETGMESDPVFTEVTQMSASASDWWVHLIGIPPNVSGAGLTPDITLVKRRIYRTKGSATTFNTYDKDYYLLEEQDINSNLILEDDYVDIKEDSLTSTSGTLVIGRWYLINTLNVGDNFSNVGYVAEGVEFKATGTTPTNWTNGTVVYRLYESLHPNVIWSAPAVRQYPSGIAFSRIGRPATFYLEDIRQIYEDDKDEINGIVDDGNGVVVLKNNNLYKIYTTGAPENWYVRRYYADVGCDDKKSIYQKGDLTFFRYSTKVYMMQSGQPPNNISEPKRNSLTTYYKTLQVTATNDWYVLLAESSTSTNQAMFIFDSQTKAWYQFSLSSVSAQAVTVKKFALANYSVESFYTVFSKKIFKYDSATHYDDISGSNVDISVTIGFPAMTIKEGYFKIRGTVTNIDRNGSGTITYSYYDMDTNSLVKQVNHTGSSEGLQKILSGFVDTPYAHMYVTITGYVKQLSMVTFFLRPMRRGKI